MRFAPSDPVFRDPIAASGPGVHTDEASSALPDIAGMLPRSDLHTLESLSPSEPRRNPGEYGELIVPYSELTRIAFAVTGMWGPDASHTKRQILASDVGQRRHLPIARENPVIDARYHLDFFDRMRDLERQLLELQANVTARYGRTLGVRVKMREQKAADKGLAAPTKAPGEPWAKEVAKMLGAVRFVLAQEGSRKPLSIFAANKLPFGISWGILAKGNAKLSFVAYSELPMATCPGAGACGIRLDQYDEGSDRKGGWCYSFSAWRQPPAFGRQFLNTLANYVDREASIMAGGRKNLSGDEASPPVYKARVSAGIAGLKHRSWPDYVKNLALTMTKKKRKTGERVFMRLFVDGDINHEDTIVAWMEAIRRVGIDGADIAKGEGHIEWYGYTKSWSAFVNVDRFIGAYGGWPKNYVVNLSSGSVYWKSEKFAGVRHAMENLPISRGYFEAVDLKSWVPRLEEQSRLLRAKIAAGETNALVPMPPSGGPSIEGSDFKPERVRDFVLLQTVRTKADLLAMFPDADVTGLGKNPEDVFQLALELYLDMLAWDPKFGAVVQREMAKDAGETEYLRLYKSESKNKIGESLLTEDKSRAATPSEVKKLHKKALALVLGEVLWSYGLGGSCPLICGNCSDHPTEPKLGVHRCASRSTLQHRVISIGLH